MSAEYLEQLNPQQRAAVEYCDGAQLVIAGAGSGKTRVLTYKIVHLLARGYEPWRIMALTFTNKAAREMRDRVVQLSGESTASKIAMGTFHSVFARILRVHADRLGFKSNYTIYDASDARNTVKMVIRDMGLDEKEYKPATLASEISKAKNALILPDQYLADPDIQRADRARKRPLTGRIYKAYMQRCRVAQALDFDDLLLMMNILLRDNNDIRRHYQEFYRYILVDEYQDTNFAQHMIVQQLVGGNKGLCVVGDDAQSIYSFRGANINNILGMKRWFPDLRTFKLEQNYRSTQNIINAAGTLIARNTRQIPKNVFSAKGPGKRIEVVRSYSDFEESFLVANRIATLKVQTGDPYSEFAILYRTNAQSRILEESLRKRNIPYRIYGGLSFYERKEVKDATSYLRLTVNVDDDEALRRIINVPARGIGETTLRKLTDAAIRNNRSIWSVLQDPVACGLNFNKGTLSRLNAFVQLIQGFVHLNETGAPADVIVREVLMRSQLHAQYMSDNTPENISRRENLEELNNSAAQFVQDMREEGADDRISLTDFLGMIALATDLDTDGQGAEGEEDRVTLMTIHAAKGLEFGNVFVVGVEEDLLPSSMSQDTLDAIEEERRLLYVAITRAKRFCMLSYASSRFRNGITAMTNPSRFLTDIDSQYLQFVTGSEIETLGRHQAGPQRWQSSAPTARHSSSRIFSNTVILRPQQHSNPQPTAATPSTVTGASLHTASELQTGMEIEHTRFGRGTIVGVDAENPAGERITVRFSNVEIKTLLLRFARFKIL